GFFGSGKKITGVEKGRALKFSVNRERVFDIKDRVKLAADGIAFGIKRAKRTLTETAHGGCAAIEKTFVDRECCRFVRAGVIERMLQPYARAKRERRLLKPALQRRQRQVFVGDNARRQRLRAEGQKISYASSAANELNL